MPEKNKAY